ncbi:universal stress protein [Flavobacterium sp. CS20]|uniref:universal stress protein n=1 Tax=Flavobacterium sp. CS20 TaxID=2775246 RepID=UPI001B3A5DF7|nr:universal stress protein [Flavobacterium sp. CS20]QTY27215.1 universal stress protein [Flavobacterium sp. CS20]
MKKILIPVDFSKPSENALRVAAELARKNDAELYVLHVVEMAETLFGTEQFNINDEQIVFFMKMVKKRFTKFLDKPYLEGLKVIDTVELGSPTMGIKELQEEKEIDFVVMGSNGASGIDEILIGSNTEKVVRHSKVPVLVVKQELEKLEINNIVFASNFDEENLNAFKKAKSFADSFDANLHLLYVNLPGNQFYSSEEITHQIKSFLDKANMSDFENIKIYNDYTIELGVINGAKALKADIIAMPTHGRKGLSHFFNGSIGEDVVNHSTLPVITFKI